MKDSELSRRDFSKLTAAAFGGILAGTVAGCGDDAKKEETKKTPEEPKATPGDPSADANDGEVETDVALLLEEPHVCRGLNTCKDKGASGKNDCAGQGTCASVEHHGCHAENACKGQGGCGDTAGINSCDKKGACHVPLMPDVWKKVRAKFEKAMTDSGKTAGAAPAAG